MSLFAVSATGVAAPKLRVVERGVQKVCVAVSSRVTEQKNRERLMITKHKQQQMHKIKV